ncbi:hypothetical protein K800_19042, partial [Salmonella enterica subsp. enterica serovar Newport str. SHSN010]
WWTSAATTTIICVVKGSSKLLSVTPIASGLQNVNKVIFIFSECNVKIIYTLRAYPIRAILLAILDLG